LEALVRNVPVIIFQVAGGDFNTIPSDAPGSMVALFSSGGELEGLIRQFALGAQSIASSTSKDIDSLRARYFLPSDERAVTQFFSA
jgi:hypothetical protein